MTLDLPTIERIKTAVANTLADQLGPQGVGVAARTLEAIDLAIADPTDPVPFPVGQRVEVAATGHHGLVRRRVESHGELHTVVVALDGLPGEHPLSPRELKVVA